MSKIPPQMWEKPEAFEDVPAEDEHEGVVDDIVHAAVGDHADHEHGPDCGHESEEHEDHIDYRHDGARHFRHEDHWDTHG